MPHDLVNSSFELSLDAKLGGSIGRARWKGLEILDERPGGSVLDSGCFPLVPFSNRIGGSQFEFDGREIKLDPNHPGDPSSPVLHGFGWLAEWTETQVSETVASLSFRHHGGQWPWDFIADQTVSVFANGFELELGITNLSSRPMPAGLGFHPYFPRNEQTVYKGDHAGEWITDAACIPVRLIEHPAPLDWWDGRAVANRLVDTVYTKRQGPLIIEWPDRGIGVRIEPSSDLAFTTVYVPSDQDFFCVEPVSHMTNALNEVRGDNGLRTLGPRERWAVKMRLAAFDL